MKILHWHTILALINKVLGTWKNKGTMYFLLLKKLILKPSQFHLEGHELTATLAAELLEPLSITELAFELTDDNPLRWDCKLDIEPLTNQ